jgi:hypothetical protein
VLRDRLLQNVSGEWEPASGKEDPSEWMVELARPRDRSSGPSFNVQFRIDPSSLAHDDKAGWLTGSLVGSGPGAPLSPLGLSIWFYADGTTRVKIKESKPIKARWEPPGKYGLRSRV